MPGRKCAARSPTLIATYSARRLEQVAENVQDNVNVMKEIARETTILTKGMHGSLEFMAHAQGVVELIEIFLVSVYAAHLTHMLAWEKDPFRGIYVAATAALGAVITAFFATKKKSHMMWVGGLAALLYMIASTIVAATMPPQEEANPRSLSSLYPVSTPWPGQCSRPGLGSLRWCWGLS